MKGPASEVERPVFKPYRSKMPTGEKKDGAGLQRISLHRGAAGNWWGWIGHKRTTGEFTDDTVAGIRFRLKNIQIDGRDLIKDVPTANDVRSTFGRWSNWFVGEIHVDPHKVVPNARRDNFEEDEPWLAVRTELTTICAALVKEARTVSDDHQRSVDVLEKKLTKHRASYLKVSRAKTLDVAAVSKIIGELEKIQKDVAKATDGAPSSDLVRLKSFSKEIDQFKSNLLKTPNTPDYERFRAAIKHEMLSKAFDVLKRFLDLSLYAEVKAALEKELK